VGGTLYAAADARSLVVTDGLTAATMYKFEVSAANTEGLGGDEDAKVTTVAIPADPGAVVEVTWAKPVQPQEVTVGRGSHIRIHWSGTHSVNEVATQAEYDNCDLSLSKLHVSQNLRSPLDIEIPTTTPDGTVRYFACSRGGHCAAGMRVAVTISGGAALSDTGECNHVACRSSSDSLNGGATQLDHRCCGLNAHGHTASCAGGFDYAWVKEASDGGSCDARTPVGCMHKAVTKHGVVPPLTAHAL